MDFYLDNITSNELDKVLNLLKSAAQKIAKKKIDHWQYWIAPPKEKVDWIKDGLDKDEFYFFRKKEDQEIIGMVRILDQDLEYWGEKKEKANYIHSLVVIEKYEGIGLGNKAIEKIESRAAENKSNYLRLDCDAANAKLCAYYEKKGFLKVGEKKISTNTYNLYEREIIG